MKRIMLLVFVLISAFSYTNAQTSNNEDFIKSNKIIQLSDKLAISKLIEIKKSSKASQLVANELSRKGYTPTGEAFSIAGIYEGEKVELIVMDYQSKDKKSTAAQLYTKKGAKTYNAIIEFKAGVEPEKGYVEHFVNGKMQLQLTHSWTSCFFNTMLNRCGTIVDANAIWKNCKKYTPFKLGKFIDCVFKEARKQVDGWVSCFWNNLWSVAWICIWQ